LFPFSDRWFSNNEKNQKEVEGLLSTTASNFGHGRSLSLRKGSVKAKQNGN
jgi:hypothetical protein